MESAQNMAALHVEQRGLFNFSGDEYDDLNANCKDTKQLISLLSTCLSQLSEKAELLAKQIDEVQEYSYSFNVKLLGIPEPKPRESAMETTELCVRRDIDIAHRVPPRDTTGGRPKPIILNKKKKKKNK